MYHDREDLTPANRRVTGGTNARLLWACIVAVLAFLATSCSVDAIDMATAMPTPAAVDSSAAQQPSPTPGAATATEPAASEPRAAAPTPTTEQALWQVFVVVETIPRGTSVAEIVQAPIVFLSARAVPEDQVLPDAFNSIAELAELPGFVVSAEIQPGEQLARSSFRDPSDFSAVAPAATPNAVLGVPAGHEVQVVVLPSTRAVQGVIYAGELVRVVATSVEPDGQAASTTLLEAVEVVGFDAVLTTGAVAIDAPRDYAITIAMSPDEASKLAAAQAESAVLTLASVLPTPDSFAVAVEMSEAQALDGQVRAGDVVNIVSVADSSDPPVGTVVAIDIDVLSVSSALGEDAPTYSLIVSVNDEELLAAVTAVALGDIALAEP